MARQDRNGVPSTSTPQVEHSPSSHPCLVPVSPRSSRRTSSSVLYGGTMTAMSSPLTRRCTATLSAIDTPLLYGLLRSEGEEVGYRPGAAGLARGVRPSGCG